MNPTAPLPTAQDDTARLPATQRLPASNAKIVLHAQTLLAGQPWVAIEHNGQHYRLQTTRAGKLILTK